MTKARLNLFVNQSNQARDLYNAKITKLLVDAIGHCDECGRLPIYNPQYDVVTVCRAKLSEIEESGGLGWSMSDRAIGMFRITSVKCEP